MDTATAGPAGCGPASPAGFDPSGPWQPRPQNRVCCKRERGGQSKSQRDTFPGRDRQHGPDQEHRLLHSGGRLDGIDRTGSAADTSRIVGCLSLVG